LDQNQTEKRVCV